MSSSLVHFNYSMSGTCGIDHTFIPLFFLFLFLFLFLYFASNVTSDNRSTCRYGRLSTWFLYEWRHMCRWSEFCHMRLSIWIQWRYLWNKFVNSLLCRFEAMTKIILVIENTENTMNLYIETQQFLGMLKVFWNVQNMVTVYWKCRCCCYNI